MEKLEVTDPLLDADNNIGFCTCVDTTRSDLFIHGCDVQSDGPTNDAFSFEVCVPTINSAMFSRMRQVLDRSCNRTWAQARDQTPILVQFCYDAELLHWKTERQAKFANSLVNRFLRAYEHTYFDLMVPRHRLDGRPLVLVTHDAETVINYTPTLLDINEVLLHYLPGHTDIERLHLSWLMGSPDMMSPSWLILLDGARHFENGNFREAILCGCSAAEIVAAPAIERWLGAMTLDGGGDGLRNAVREMGNPLRFDLCISTVYKEAFADLDHREKLTLLADLRGMNALRNRVVHAGEEPDPSAAVTGLQAAAMFVCKIWLATLGTGGASA
jgi:hypothetical protein